MSTKKSCMHLTHMRGQILTSPVTYGRNGFSKKKQVEEFVELVQIQITAGADHFIAAVAGAVFGHGHFSYCQVAAKKDA
jgi:hypothetical protein